MILWAGGYSWNYFDSEQTGNNLQRAVQVSCRWPQTKFIYEEGNFMCRTAADIHPPFLLGVLYA